MKIVLDTNIVISGIFFTGPPFEILSAWQQGKIDILLAPDILDEYYRVADELKERFSEIDAEPLLTLIANNSEIIPNSSLGVPVCEDTDDDKFISCAVSGNAQYIISGDKHLLNVGKYKDVSILNPSTFAERYLKQ